ncbi:MAG: UDP-N-acetylmuramate--L-alanine ligase, partial [Bacteroidetes bacterium]|nr:UDP-N-acetylmuramate--L-alanine ligase [Bacteroidota bacterium]
MNTLSNIQSIYFVGIGGIGMSALARFAIKKNLAVFGYDKTQTALTATLEKEG